MNEQRERARADAAAKRATVTVSELPTVRSEFSGYSGITAQGTILAILVDGASVERVEQGANAQLILDRTAFYAEKGGQIGDRGEILAGDNGFDVTDTQGAHEAIVHHGVVRRGAFAVGDAVETLVFPEWRAEIRRHHTSAHLLQRALREVARQRRRAGRLVGRRRPHALRFPQPRRRAEPGPEAPRRTARERTDSRRLSSRNARAADRRSDGDRRDHDGRRKVRRRGARRLRRAVGRVLRRNARALDGRAGDVRAHRGVVDRRRRAAHRGRGIARGRGDRRTHERHGRATRRNAGDET